MVPLFQALLDYDSSPEVYERYDRISARDLFRQYGVSQRRAPLSPPGFWTLITELSPGASFGPTRLVYSGLTALAVFVVYDEFLKPLLLVALFAPPEELSAGVVLGAFYFYTLAHQSDFDVCWCKVLIDAVNMVFSHR